ncbi:fumarate reductase [Mycobacterium tuberculosis]|nr:fumarate reductase [Mycobacterium tuberculosis]
MMDRIVMEVSRYRPEIESAPTFQAYEVPLTREWAVLDGLTYIKDHLDGTLSFRWSCRMGICGSSGMTINGDPKLACATFLADYLPRAGAGGADAKLPGDPRSRCRHQ